MTSKTERAAFLGGAMTAVCELMCSYGLSKSAATRQFELALVRGYMRGIQKPSREASPISEMAFLCGRWHIDKSCLDKIGNPKPLTWDGRNGSLLKLARRVNGKSKARQVVEELISRKLIRKTKNGAWIPKARVVAPRGLDTAQTLRTSAMIDNLIRTIAHNSKRKYRGSDLLLDVLVQVPLLPARDLNSFKRFSKSQGLNFAKTVDDWLESRNLSKAPGHSRRVLRTRNVGVLVVAFEKPTAEG